MSQVKQVARSLLSGRTVPAGQRTRRADGLLAAMWDSGVDSLNGRRRMAGGAGEQVVVPGMGVLRQLLPVLGEYVEHYNVHRPHRTLSRSPPA
jgi:hypothetical protein